MKSKIAAINSYVFISGQICLRNQTSCKTKEFLPKYYTDVPPVTCGVERSPVPPANVMSLNVDSFTQHEKAKYKWLEHTKGVINSKLDAMQDVS